MTPSFNETRNLEYDPWPVRDKTSTLGGYILIQSFQSFPFEIQTVKNQSPGLEIPDLRYRIIDELHINIYFKSVYQTNVLKTRTQTWRVINAAIRGLSFMNIPVLVNTSVLKK